MSNHSPSVFGLASALVIVALLTAGPFVPLVQAAKDGSISITADKQTVNPGDTDTLHIKLQNVKNATLDGEALKGNKIDRKVQVCETTTYTVAAEATGGQKLSQSLTVNASGFSSIQACLPDLALSALAVTSQLPSKDAPKDLEDVCVNITIENRGKTATPASDLLLTASGDVSPSVYPRDIPPLGPGGCASVSPVVCTLRPHGELTTLTVAIDPKNQIIESDESNNTRFITVKVMPEDTIQLQLPQNVPNFLKT
jgi:hypothetical protein